jgi:hypothetical protein
MAGAHKKMTALKSTARACLRGIAGLTMMKVADGLRRSGEKQERQKVDRDFDKLRRQQTGRKGLLQFVRYFWHSLEPRAGLWSKAGPWRPSATTWKR